MGMDLENVWRLQPCHTALRLHWMLPGYRATGLLNPRLLESCLNEPGASYLPYRLGHCV